MKKYFWPLAVSVVINALIIIAVLHVHMNANSDSPNAKTPPNIKINLSQVVKHLNAAHKTSALSTESWLKKHYGKSILIDRHFTAGKNLTGYVVGLKSDPQDQAIIYSVNKGEYFLIGTVIDKHGKNISPSQCATLYHQPQR